MPISSSDIKYKLSVKTGSAGNSTAQSNVNESLGKYISTTETTDATLNNLFDDVSGDENAASDVEYRCVFIHNAHASLTLQNAKLWVYSQVGGGASASIGLDPAGNSPIGQISAQAAEIANEGAAPAGVSFSAPADKASGLSVGNLAAGYCCGVWIRRTAANTSALNNDDVILRIEGESAA